MGALVETTIILQSVEQKFAEINVALYLKRTNFRYWNCSGCTTIIFQLQKDTAGKTSRTEFFMWYNFSFIICKSAKGYWLQKSFWIGKHFYIYKLFNTVSLQGDSTRSFPVSSEFIFPKRCRIGKVLLTTLLGKSWLIFFDNLEFCKEF